jgi:predicted small metal-binding protein
VEDVGVKLVCKDLGVDCPYVAHGDTEEELMADVAEHAKKVHGYTDEQLKDPKLAEQLKALIKKE